jgi:hypothetical protein
MFSTLQTRLTVDDIALFAANTSHETPEEQCQCRHGHDEMMHAKHPSTLPTLLPLPFPKVFYLAFVPTKIHCPFGN